MDPLTERVQRLAYLLWEKAGRPTDRGDEFWAAAEAQVKLAFAKAPVDDSVTTERKCDGPGEDPAARSPPP
jgi:hypothetical protein